VGLNATSRRRWTGAIFLLVATAMLIAGETLLKGHLRDLSFLLYWLICILCTGAAIIVACADARSVHTRSKQEARDLIEKTLSKVEADVLKAPRLRPDKDKQPSLKKPPPDALLD
jgi:hypothetical protein